MVESYMTNVKARPVSESKRRRTSGDLPTWSHRGQVEWTVAAPHPEGAQVLVAGPFDFAPGESKGCTVELGVPLELIAKPGDELEGVLTASFPSPGTGAALSVQRQFAIGALSFCIPALDSSLPPTDPPMCERRMRVKTDVLRSVFKISPRRGLRGGALTVFKDSVQTIVSTPAPFGRRARWHLIFGFGGQVALVRILEDDAEIEELPADCRPALRRDDNACESGVCGSAMDGVSVLLTRGCRR